MDNRTQGEDTASEPEEAHAGDIRLEEESDKAIGEYSRAHIVRHVGEGYTVKYVVLWQGYTRADETVEPPAHILEHFILAIDDRKRTQGSRIRKQGTEGTRMHATDSTGDRVNEDIRTKY